MDSYNPQLLIRMDVKDGPQEFFFENGQVQMKSIYKNNVQILLSLRKNGQLIEKLLIRMM